MRRTFARLSRLIVEENAVLGLRIDGRYHVLDRAGSGGMGEVFRARDLRLDRVVAMKLLGVRGGRWASRFKAEARTMTRLDHPGIVPIYDLGALPDGRLYYTMKYVAGRTLEAMIEAGEPRDRLLSILARTADVVDYAHDREVLHRDLKPSNIMVDGAGAAYVLDWGVARVLAAPTESEDDQPARPGTRAGTILGTPEYMPPEQARGVQGAADRRSDVFGLGAVLFHLLTGRAPFEAETPQERLFRSAAGDAPPPREINPEIPPELEAICQKSIHPDPARRYPTARALAVDLRRFLDGDLVGAFSAGWSYRLRKALGRRRKALAVAAAAIALSAFVPAWIKERSERRLTEIERATVERASREREEELRELLGRWGEVVLARQEWYQAHRDPRRTRMKIETALAGLEGFIRKRPGHPQARYIRARARLALDDLEGAAADLEAAIRQEPAFGPGWELLGRVKIERYRQAFWSRVYHKERFDRAAPYLVEAERAFEEASRSGSGPGSVAAWGLAKVDEDAVAQTIARALTIAYLQKDPARGRKTIEDAHAASPSEEYCNLLGFWSPSPEAKIHWQTEAIRIRPHYPVAYVDRALAKLEKGDAPGAIADCGQALEINPSFVQAYATRAHAREMTKEFAAAVRDATEAIRLDPSHAASFSCRAYSRWLMGDTEGALDDLSQALRFNPREPMLYYYRGEGRVGSGDFEGAIADASAAIRLDPHLECAYFSRAAAKERLGRGAEAIEDFRKALECARDDARRSSIRARLEGLGATD